MDWSPPGSSVHGIFQARISEWEIISFSQGSSRPRDRTHISCISYIGRCFLYHCNTCDVDYTWLFTSIPAISLKSNNHNNHPSTKTPLFQNIWGHAHTHTHHTHHTYHTHPPPHTHPTHTHHTYTTLTHTHSLPLLTLPESATTYFYSLFLGRQPILCGLDLVGRNQILVQCLSVQETLIKLSKHSPWSLSVSLMQGIATDCPPSTNPVKDGT